MVRRVVGVVAWATVSVLAGGGAGVEGRQAAPPAGVQEAGEARSDPAVNRADIDFMAGMIPHHAQAVLIAGWAASHGARQDVRILCERQVVAQRDEIKIMQTWLADRGLAVPAADATHHRMVMGGVEHDMLMPGMLTDAELKQLDQARGPEWDRLFLTFMIKHHRGALEMVDDLFESYGAAQDETVFRLASDIYADQLAEIERMQLMLSGGGQPS